MPSTSTHSRATALKRNPPWSSTHSIFKARQRTRSDCEPRLKSFSKPRRPGTCFPSEVEVTCSHDIRRAHI